jgi:hypothetical protein
MKRSILPKVFLSHINEERGLAMLVKDLIATCFEGQVDVFVSSDPDSLPRGSRWLTVISQTLEQCCFELVLCSPTSVKRPWVNFELGAGWVRESIPIVPLCHSGLSVTTLPSPLNQLHAADLDNPQHVEETMQSIADSVTHDAPSADWGAFCAQVTEWSETYTYWEILNGLLSSLPNKLTQAILRGQTIIEMVRSEDANSVVPALKRLAQFGLIQVRGLGMMMSFGGRAGSGDGYEISPGPKHGELVADKRLHGE